MIFCLALYDKTEKEKKEIAAAQLTKEEMKFYYKEARVIAAFYSCMRVATKWNYEQMKRIIFTSCNMSLAKLQVYIKTPYNKYRRV